jgi:hypothetical protein
VNIQNAAITTALFATASVTSLIVANAAILNVHIADATITNAKIANVDASKITSGVISASVSISMVSGSFTVAINATDHVKVTDTASSRFARVTANQIRIEKTTDAFSFAQIIGFAFTASSGDGLGNAGGQLTLQSNFSGAFLSLKDGSGVEACRLDASTSQLSIGGLKVVAARKTGWSTATGTASRASFDTATVSTSGLAQVVKAMLDDLHASGSGHALFAA